MTGNQLTQANTVMKYIKLKPNLMVLDRYAPYFDKLHTSSEFFDPT